MHVVYIQAVVSLFLMIYRIIAIGVSNSDRITDKRELQKHAWGFSLLPPQSKQKTIISYFLQYNYWLCLNILLILRLTTIMTLSAAYVILKHGSLWNIHAKFLKGIHQCQRLRLCLKGMISVFR